MNACMAWFQNLVEVSVAVINSTIDDHLNFLRDGSHRDVPCNGSNAIYSHGYTPSIGRAIHQSAKDSREGRVEGESCLVNVVIAASALCARSAPPRSPAAVTACCACAMLPRFPDNKEVSRRAVEPRAKLQAGAERNRQ